MLVCFLMGSRRRLYCLRLSKQVALANKVGQFLNTLGWRRIRRVCSDAPKDVYGFMLRAQSEKVVELAEV